MASTDQGPIYKAIQKKFEITYTPTLLDIENESHKHAHHAAMQGNTNPETHFRVHIVSDKFDGMKLIERHQNVYNLLKEEMKTIHALSLSLKTPTEAAKVTQV